MPTPAISRWRAALATHLLTDATRGSTLAGIAKVAPQSALLAIPAIAASYAALTAKGAALGTDVDAVAATEALLAAKVTQRTQSRAAFDLELVTLKSLVDNFAGSGGDVTGMGFLLLTRARASRTPPDPPVGMPVVSVGRARGRARVTLPAAGNTGVFAAEAATDPLGVWSSLPGAGRQRKLEGATGARLWVRFARVRFGMQSDWTTPILVTLA